MPILFFAAMEQAVAIALSIENAPPSWMIPALRRVVVEVDLDEEKIVLDENVLEEVAVWEDEPAERDE